MTATPSHGEWGKKKAKWRDCRCEALSLSLAKQTPVDTPIMVDIHIDLFHAYYAVYLEDNRWVRCFFSKPVPTFMDSFAPEVTVESLLNYNIMHENMS